VTRRGRTVAVLGLALAGAGVAWWWRAPATPAPAVTAAPEGAGRRVLWTCGMHPQVLRDEPGSCPICGMQLTPVAVDGHDAHADGGAVVIDPATVQNMGIRTATVIEAVLGRSVRAVGYFAEAEPARRDVNLRVSGWIERLHADTEGMHVEAGAPLFDLYSPEVRVAVEEMIAARRARTAAGDGVAGAAAEATFRAAAGKLRLWGLDAAEIERLARADRAPDTVTIRSPITGHVVVKEIVAGAAVQAGQQALRIVDHSRLWLDAQVFEQDLRLVEIGRPARATVAAMPGREFAGEVTFVHPHVHPVTRTTTVRLVVANPTLELRPGMYATVDIDSPPLPAAPLVPREAVIDSGKRQVAFVAHAGGRFEPRQVVMGTEGDDGMVQILSGLAPGETVVTSGQFLLDSESRLREAIQKHLGAAPSHAGHAP
jgi:RND family efflux transporter MFP subunit